jgi:hypothetical protein
VLHEVGADDAASGRAAEAGLACGPTAGAPAVDLETELAMSR